MTEYPINTPIAVVSGLPRSGTSMMMRMLEAGGLPLLADHVRRADEDNPNGYCEFEAVKRLPDDSAWLEHAPGKAVKVISLLLHSLPGTYCYRILFMQRDLGEMLASQQAMLKRRAALGKIDAALIEPERLRLEEESLRIAYAKHLEQMKAWLPTQPHMKTCWLEYQDVLSTPKATAERVNAFLGGGLDEASMAATVNPALYRQRH